MPVTFDISVTPRLARGWHSSSVPLTMTSNERFMPATMLDGGACGCCRGGQVGAGWASNNYILCITCAVTTFIGPNLRTIMPQLFLEMPPDEDYSDESEAIPECVTKRDKEFDPRKYRHYVHTEHLSGKFGCAGYKCQTYAAPLRTIPAGVAFMTGEGYRGNLCVACFAKLQTQYNASPARVTCPQCERRVLQAEHTQTTISGHIVCNRCIANSYMATPETDGGWVLRAGAAWAIIHTEGQPDRRVYASQAWANAHWFQGTTCWYTTEAERDAEMYSADVPYRDERIHSNANYLIFGYGTNIIKMLGFPTVTKRDELCFGVELEMQATANHTQANVVKVLGGKFVADRPYILCADSSIGAAGVEMITLPYTLANHKSDKYMPWTKLLGELRKVAQSGQNTTACGMHVHINRRALSNLQMGKMLVVVNSPEMQELIVTIAQRSESLYARRFYKKVTEGGKIIGSHSDALNMSNNKGTCELRIFRGNLRYERVMKNLEFTEALCLYAAEQSIQKLSNPALMVEWINDNKAHYPHLVKFLAEEYQPTKAFARYAARARASNAWEETCANVIVEPTEGDI